jgi:acyl-CoA thioesterase-1
MKYAFSLLVALLVTPLGLLLAADAPKPPMADVFVTPKRDRAGMNSDVPIDKSLPNVLILGDSISIGYTRQVREGLKGKAKVIRPNANCGDTRHGLAQIETWLGDGKWRVIQFNWGQHALKWMQGKEYSREPREGYTRCIPLERYGAELEKLVMELKKTGRPLMWATTTPANNGSQPDDAEAYNAVALQVMHKHQIPVNDLQRFVRQSQLPMQGCHFPREASERLGNQVAGQLLDAVSRN